MMAQMFELDFSLLPEFTGQRALLCLPPYLEDALSALGLPDTVDRLKGASYFIGKLSARNDLWQNRAYLRAGLSDFRSVAQALGWDVGRTAPVHSPEKSRNPLVHLVFRLRRVAVYRESAETAEQQITATFRVLGDEHQVPIKVLLIKDIERYLRRENLSLYRDSDITEVCAWFDAMQRRYGASQVLDAGVQMYCDELLQVYAHRASGPT